MRVPQIVVTTIANAAATGSAYTYDLLGVDRASIQLNATLSSTNTSVVTLKISNDGINFVGFSTAKTVTMTGGGTLIALFELGAIDYRYLQVVYGTPSGGTLTMSGYLNAVATTTQGV